MSAEWRDAVSGRAGRLAACARAFHVRAAVCKLRTFALFHQHAPHVRARLPSRYVVRAAGGTPPKRTLSASSATRLRHGCSCLREVSHSSTPRQGRVERPRRGERNVQAQVCLLLVSSLPLHTLLSCFIVRRRVLGEWRSLSSHCVPSALPVFLPPGRSRRSCWPRTPP